MLLVLCCVEISGCDVMWIILSVPDSWFITESPQEKNQPVLTDNSNDFPPLFQAFRSHKIHLLWKILSFFPQADHKGFSFSFFLFPSQHVIGSVWILAAKRLLLFHSATVMITCNKSVWLSINTTWPLLKQCCFCPKFWPLIYSSRILFLALMDIRKQPNSLALCRLLDGASVAPSAVTQYSLCHSRYLLCVLWHQQ